LDRVGLCLGKNTPDREAKLKEQCHILNMTTFQGCKPFMRENRDMINCQKFLPKWVKIVFNRLVSCWLVVRQKYLEETEILDGEPLKANRPLGYEFIKTFLVVCSIPVNKKIKSAGLKTTRKPNEPETKGNKNVYLKPHIRTTAGIASTPRMLDFGDSLTNRPGRQPRI
jgi:hypothetical protein